MKFVWEGRYWEATHGMYTGIGATRWTAFWNWVHFNLLYVWFRVHDEDWSWGELWGDVFDQESS